MAKKKINIDLGNLRLSDEAYQKLLDLVYETVDGNVELKKKKTTRKKPKPAAQMRGLRDAAPPPPTDFPVTVSVTIRDTEPGLSQIFLIHGEVKKELDQSGSIIFKNVNHGEYIGVRGKSLGKVEINFDVETVPATKTLGPGVIFYSFKVV